MNRAQLGPAATAALESFRSPTMPAEAEYALLTSAKSSAKPWVFGDLTALARRIHRDRAGQALELRPDRIMIRGAQVVRHVVAVYGVDQRASRTRFIGYAWLRGQGVQVLQRALEEIEPNMGAQAEAA